MERPRLRKPLGCPADAAEAAVVQGVVLTGNHFETDGSSRLEPVTFS